MSIADRRRKHLAWCRYLIKIRGQMPTDSWQWRAPRCFNTRASGVVRAWEKTSRDLGGWPWKPNMLLGTAGRRPGAADVLLAHDLPPRYETVHLPEEAA